MRSSVNLPRGTVSSSLQATPTTCADANHKGVSALISSSNRRAVLGAIEQIKAIYAIEEAIREQNLPGVDKQLHRLTHSRRLAELFFDWVDRQFERQGFTPSNPFIQALNYVRERRFGLEVFLTDPDVPLDTNHIERALRVIPVGRKLWLFLLDRTGRTTRRHHSELDRYVPTARHRFVHVSG